MQRWKIWIEYDGGKYYGWQRQADVPTVQQHIEEALYKFCQQKIILHVAGRTDAGVHALGQVAHFDLDYGDRPLEGYDLVKALNAHLRPEKIAVIAAEKTGEEFHARHSAVNKLYRYHIVQRTGFLALDRGRCWHIRRPLNVGAMHEAAQILLGQHDFTTFRDSECQAASPVKTLDRLDVTERPYDAHGGRAIIIEGEAKSFLHHQMRNMVGSLVLVGEGKWTKADLKQALEAQDRKSGGPTAPPDGLYLVRVDYTCDETVKTNDGESGIGGGPY